MKKSLQVLAGSLAFGALAAFFAQPACKAQQCTPSALTPNEPSPALECAAGLLCYQGQCIRACNAGQEGGPGAIECTSNGDCDGARPNCVEFASGASFCSACDPGEFCVQTLNICQLVNQVEFTDPPPVPPVGAPKPPAPLDGSVINPGLTLVEDGGINVIPPDRVITQVGLVDVARIEDFTTGVAVVSSKAAAELLNVEDASSGVAALEWESDPWDDIGAAQPPAIRTVIQQNGECTLFGLDSSTASAAEPVNLGDITLDNHADFPNSISRTSIPFSGGDYMDPVVPASLYSFSRLTPQEAHFIVATSMGSTIYTDGQWPEATPNGHHVPFALVPAPDTLMDIQGTIAVNRATPADLIVRWDPITVGSVPGEKVILRFRGSDYLVRCEQIEGSTLIDSIIVKAGLLDEFITAEAVGAGTTLPIYFERASEERLDIRPAIIEGSMTEPPETYVINVSIRVRHTLIGRVRFM